MCPTICSCKLVLAASFSPPLPRQPGNFMLLTEADDSPIKALGGWETVAGGGRRLSSEVAGGSLLQSPTPPKDDNNHS